jgi:hypothetical protein
MEIIATLLHALLVACDQSYNQNPTPGQTLAPIPPPPTTARRLGQRGEGRVVRLVGGLGTARARVAGRRGEEGRFGARAGMVLRG